MEVPIELCEACPVRMECGDLWSSMQTDFDNVNRHETKQYLDGVWEGETKPGAGHAFGQFPVTPCGDDCTGQRTRGACRNHYQQQYDQHHPRKR